jgi:hypothetical protein
MNRLTIIDVDGRNSVHDESSSSSSSGMSNDDTTNVDGIGSGGSSHMSSNDDNHNNTNHPINEMTKYAALENKLVNRWRRIVIMSILVIGAIVCCITYATLRNAEIDDSHQAVCLCTFFRSPLHIYVSRNIRVSIVDIYA